MFVYYITLLTSRIIVLDFLEWQCIIFNCEHLSVRRFEITMSNLYQLDWRLELGNLLHPSQLPNLCREEAVLLKKVQLCDHTLTYCHPHKSCDGLTVFSRLSGVRNNKVYKSVGLDTLREQSSKVCCVLLEWMVAHVHLFTAPTCIQAVVATCLNWDVPCSMY